MRNSDLVKKLTSKVKDESFHENKWGERHFKAWTLPNTGSEAMIKSLIVGWIGYADQYHASTGFEPSSTLAEDTYAGQYWIEIAHSIINLLSMDLGRLDGGTLDRIVREVAMNEGFTEDVELP